MTLHKRVPRRAPPYRAGPSTVCTVGRGALRSAEPRGPLLYCAAEAVTDGLVLRLRMPLRE